MLLLACLARSAVIKICSVCLKGDLEFLVVLKSILLTFNLVYCRFKFDRYSYNSCTQPSKRQPHKHSSRNSDERGRIPRAFKDVLTHLKIMRFGVVFGVRGRIRINLKGTCLERN